MIRLCSRFVVPRIRVYRVPHGSAGTLVTARMIGRLIREGAKDFYVRQKAIQIFRGYGVLPKNRFGEVVALFDWVKKTSVTPEISFGRSCCTPRGECWNSGQATATT